MVKCAAALLNASPTSFGGRGVYGGGYSRDSWNVDASTGTVWATVSGQHKAKDDEMVRSALREGRPVHVFRRDTRVSKMFTYHGVVSRGSCSSSTGRTVFHLGIERPAPRLCGGPFRGSWFRAALESIGVDTAAMGTRTFMTCFYEFELPEGPAEPATGAGDGAVVTRGAAPPSISAAAPSRPATAAAETRGQGAGAAGAGATAKAKTTAPAALAAATKPCGTAAVAAAAVAAAKEGSR